ncbi:MAG: haloacid dehalogenase type II [Notoacmeibacter sp.]|nr:haloacid dehalogenase type II [Notoacmeibacter sp.]
MQHKAFVFDAYGTLFDVHAAVRRHASEAGPDGQLLSDIWRAKQLEYSWIASLSGTYRDFWTLTREALDFAFAKVPSVDPALKDRLLDAYWSLDCYEEVPAVLRALKAAGARTAILSNGSPDMLEAAVRNSALEDLLDEVYSVDALRCFKTDPRVYEMVTLDWKLYPSAVSFQSSNRWDIAGAASFGFHCVWINRTGQPDEYRHLPPARILPSLSGLV